MAIVIVLVLLFIVVSGVVFKPIKKNDQISHIGRFRNRI